MKKIVRGLLVVTTLFIGLGIGTIALYASNDRFKGFLDGMVEKHAGSGHTSEYVVADAASSDYVSDYSENQIVHNDMESSYTDSESNSYNTDLPGDYREQAYDDTYGYDYYADDVTSDKVASESESEYIESYEVVYAPQETEEIQEQEDISLSEETIDIDTANEISEEETEVQEEIYIPEEELQQETMYVIDHNDTGGDYFEEPIYDDERARILLNSVIVIPGNFNGWTIDEVLRWKKNATNEEQQAMYDQSYPWYPADADTWEPEQLKLWAIIEPITIRNRFDRVVLWGTGYDVNN